MCDPGTDQVAVYAEAYRAIAEMDDTLSRELATLLRTPGLCGIHKGILRHSIRGIGYGVIAAKQQIALALTTFSPRGAKVADELAKKFDHNIEEFADALMRGEEPATDIAERLRKEFGV